MKKLLSLIIPVYNMEAYIAGSLDSVVFVADPEVECLVIDDGSTDASLSIALEYEKKYPEIIRVISKENGGYGDVVNTGISLACGKYVKILDSDDFLNVDVWGRYLELLKHRSEDIVFNNVVMYDEHTSESVGYFNRQIVSCFEKSKNDMDIVPYNFFIHNCCFKKEILSGLQCPRKCLYTDNIIVLHAYFNAMTLYFSDFDLYMYRINRDGQSINISVSAKKFNDALTVCNTLMKMFQVSGIVKKGFPEKFYFNILEVSSYRYVIALSMQKNSCYSYGQFKEFRRRLKALLRVSQFRLSDYSGFTMKLLLAFPMSFFIIHFYNRHKGR